MDRNCQQELIGNMSDRGRDHFISPWDTWPGFVDDPDRIDPNGHPWEAVIGGKAPKSSSHTCGGQQIAPKIS